MVDIYGKDKATGTLSRLDTIQLDGSPVQIEVIAGDEVNIYFFICYKFQTFMHTFCRNKHI